MNFIGTKHTKLEPISLEEKIENPFLNFCVGVWVGARPRANFSHRLHTDTGGFKLRELNGFKYFGTKNRSQKKVIAISYPGIQQSHG